MLALQALCAFEGVGDEFGEQLDEFLRDGQSLSELDIETPPPNELVHFARTLALGAWAQHEKLDQMLSQTASHWSVKRMTPVDRNILRMGMHELLEHPETPPQVTINEAIELARRFGDTDSPAFVNGVLDAARGACAETSDSATQDQEVGGETEDSDGAL